MAEGLWEWCEDTYERQPVYASAIDPICTSRGQFRVLRGGPDLSGKYGGPIKARHYQDAKARLASVGLRLVRDEQGTAEEATPEQGLREPLPKPSQRATPILAKQLPTDPAPPAAQPAAPAPQVEPAPPAKP